MKTVMAIGKNVDAAIQSGLDQLGISREDAIIEVLDEGSRGVFGMFGAKLARVAVTDKNAMEEPEEAFVEEEIIPEEEPVEEEQPQEPVYERSSNYGRSNRSGRGRSRNSSRGRNDRSRSREDHAPRPDYSYTYEEAPEYEHPAAIFLCDLARKMGIPRPEIKVEEDEDGVYYVDIDGDHVGVFIGHHGDALDAIQMLTTLVVNPQGRDADVYHRVVLDVSGYRKRREETLTKLALRMADRVLDSGEPVDLEPMSAYERRIIHTALSNVEGIETHSEGEEPYRHIVIDLIPEEEDDE